jgi:hypothetical protein
VNGRTRFLEQRPDFFFSFFVLVFNVFLLFAISLFCCFRSFLRFWEEIGAEAGGVGVGAGAGLGAGDAGVCLGPDVVDFEMSDCARSADRLSVNNSPSTLRWDEEAV